MGRYLILSVLAAIPPSMWLRICVTPVGCCIPRRILVHPKGPNESDVMTVVTERHLHEHIIIIVEVRIFDEHMASRVPAVSALKFGPVDMRFHPNTP